MALTVRTTLYVANLHANVTEAMLLEKFTGVGPVSSAQIYLSAMSSEPTRYAEVRFRQAADAVTTMKTMNGDILNGRELYIIFREYPLTPSRCYLMHVFISNLDKTIDKRSLHETFSAFGTILSCEITIDEFNRSKGFAVVRFETEEEADKAVDKANGILLGSKRMVVSPFPPRRHCLDMDVPQTWASVSTSSERIWGEYESECNVPSFADDDHLESDQTSTVSRFQEEDGEALLQNRYGTSRKRSDSSSRYKGMNLYIKNLADSIDDKRLKREFSEFGTITSAKVMTEDGNSKGFGFVCFSTPDEATKAIAKMNNTIVDGKQLYVALAQNKEERRICLTKEHSYRKSTSCVPAQTQILPSYRMSMMMPQLSSSIGGSRLRGFYQPALMPRAGPRNIPTCGLPPRWKGAGTGSANFQVRSQHSEVEHFATFFSIYHFSKGQIIDSQLQWTQASPDTSEGRISPPNNSNLFPSYTVDYELDWTTAPATAEEKPEEQNQAMRDRLLPMIQQIQTDLVGKVADMILKLEKTEQLRLLDSREALKSKVEEAMALLLIHRAEPLPLISDPDTS